LKNQFFKAIIDDNLIISFLNIRITNWYKWRWYYKDYF